MFVLFLCRAPMVVALGLSTALARLRYDEAVSQADVEEALRLMHCSKASLIDVRTAKARHATNPINDIYNVMYSGLSLHSIATLALTDLSFCSHE